MDALNLPGLRIAEDRVEWAVECARGICDPLDDERQARNAVCVINSITVPAVSCGPHRLVSRRVITTCWETVDGEAQQCQG